MKKNFIAKYFENFGLRQISQLLLLAGVITLIVALFLTNLVTACTVLVIVGSSVVALGAIIGLVGHVLTVLKTNRHRVEFKHAVINIVVSAVLLIVAVVAIIVSAGELVIY